MCEKSYVYKLNTKYPSLKLSTFTSMLLLNFKTNSVKKKFRKFRKKISGIISHLATKFGC